jgi:predicted kinase
MGLPGSGKSYFAVQLAKLTGAEYISSNKLRYVMLKYPTYSDKETWVIYDEMLRRAAGNVREGKDVVLDAAFYTRALRTEFIRVLEEMTRTFCIELVADEGLIRARLKRPREDGDANFEVYQEIKEVWEPVQEPRLVLRSTDENIESMLDETMEYIHRQAYINNV